MKELACYLVLPASSMRDVIRAIDRNAAQIALVVDAERRLLGTVTDGDVRRALLRGETLETRVEDIMRRDFRSLHEGASEGDARALMRREVLYQVPVLDWAGRVVRLILRDDLVRPAELPNPVVLMAGGEGRRLWPLTENCPKPMLPVGGRPLLEIILEQCIDAGFREFYISVNYLKQRIQHYFGDGSRWNVSIRYLEEDEPLGTAGALGLLPGKSDEPLLVVNGDVLTHVDFRSLVRFHEERRASATICVCEHSTQIPFGVVHLDGGQVCRLEEKPWLSSFVNAGLYLINPEVLKQLPKGGYCDMPNLLERVIESNQSVAAFPIHEYWLDVGYPDSFRRANGEGD